MVTDTPLQTVLFVCTGNVCRSPYLEYSLRATLERSAATGIAAISAGIAAHPGMKMAPRIAAALATQGVDATAFRARPLERTMVSQAHLIVTADRAHRDAVIRANREAAHRTFTLLQLARLLTFTGDGTTLRRGASPTEIVAVANHARGMAGSSLSDDDIEDPWRRSRWVYARAVSRLDTGLAVLTDSLLGQHGLPPHQEDAA